MVELDWRERPMMSPLGGFLIQTRVGDTGNFEVVIAWPDGGLAHFMRDNDVEPAFPWHGPTLFGSGEYVGATVIESDFRFIADNELGNLEVLATRSDGTVDQYWRENGARFLWHGPLKVFDSAGGAPSMAYSGAPFLDPDIEHRHGDSKFYVATPVKGAGFSFRVRHNGSAGEFGEIDVIEWKELVGTGSVTLSGVALAVTTIGHFSDSAGYKWVGPGGQRIVAGVAPHLGWLLIFGMTTDITTTPADDWRDQTVFGRDVFPELKGEFVGRPCLIQGDYGYEKEGGPISIDEWGHLGNLELVVPAKAGGVLHFARDCGIPRAAPKPLSQGWGGPTRIPGPVYDEVSLIQSNFARGEHGNLEMIARQLNQRGFDYFWRDEGFVWHGPSPVGEALPPTGTTTQPLTVTDTLLALRSAGVDFSVPELKLRRWLNNPSFTPYPAIAGALLKMLEGKRLRQPVFLDVIRSKYEDVLGGSSPRSVEDVDFGLLREAVLRAYNERYGEAVGDFQSLVR